MKENLNLNIKEKIIIEPRYNNLNFIHYYDKFYSTNFEESKNEFDFLNKVFHRLVIANINNDNFLVIVSDNGLQHFRSAETSFFYIVNELKKIYSNLTSKNILFVHKQNSFFNSNFIYPIANKAYYSERFSSSKAIQFINGTLYDFINIYSYTNGYNISDRINCIIKTGFKDSDIIEYLRLSYEKNETLFLFLKYTMINEDIYDFYDFNNFLIQAINDKKIDFKPNENCLHFINNDFLNSSNYNKDIFKHTPFFNDNYLIHIKTEKMNNRNKHLIPFIIKNKLSSF